MNYNPELHELVTVWPYLGAERKYGAVRIKFILRNRHDGTYSVNSLELFGETGPVEILKTAMVKLRTRVLDVLNSRLPRENPARKAAPVAEDGNEGA